jgi:hypothetical protein
VIGPIALSRATSMAPGYETGSDNPLRWPHVVVPVNAIRRNIIERLTLFDKETRADE